MRTRFLLVAAVGLLLLGADAPKDKEAAKDEAKKLEGTWKVVSGEAGGMKVEDEKLLKEIVFQGDKLTLKQDKGGQEGTFRVDPSQKPKALDFIVTRDGKDLTIPLIYSLDGDELKVVIPLVEPGKLKDVKRPDSFETKDKPLILLTAKRDKK
jgi:uncharacterized protein (TIGR03067 family)